MNMTSVLHMMSIKETVKSWHVFLDQPKLKFQIDFHDWNFCLVCLFIQSLRPILIKGHPPTPFNQRRVEVEE